MSLRSIGLLTGLALIATVLAPEANASSRIRTLNAPGCKWIGTRVVQSLIRDDIIAANEYNDMYKTMACPAKSLILAFSCTVKRVSAPEANPDLKQSVAPHNDGKGQAQASQGLSRLNKAQATQQIIDACWGHPRAK